jgi:hypothetical protein
MIIKTENEHQAKSNEIDLENKKSTYPINDYDLNIGNFIFYRDCILARIEKLNRYENGINSLDIILFKDGNKEVALNNVDLGLINPILIWDKRGTFLKSLGFIQVKELELYKHPQLGLIVFVNHLSRLDSSSFTTFITCVEYFNLSFLNTEISKIVLPKISKATYLHQYQNYFRKNNLTFPNLISSINIQSSAQIDYFELLNLNIS